MTRAMIYIELLTEGVEEIYWFRWVCDRRTCDVWAGDVTS
jgi:hypothetical protein